MGAEALSINAAAKAIGHKSKTQLIRFRDRGLLDGYLTADGLVNLHPAGQPHLRDWVKANTAHHATPAIRTTAPPKNFPPYEDSKAKSEAMRAALLELEFNTKESLLIPRDQVEKAAANVAAIVRTKLLAMPTRARQRIPHLTLEEVAILDELQREALEELADGR